VPNTSGVIRPPLPPSSDRPPSSPGALGGVALWIVAGLSIWLFGFWGIGIVALTVLVTGLVEGVNLASGDLVLERRRSRPSAQLHAVGTEVIGDVLGFGTAAVLGIATSASPAGVLAVAATAIALNGVVGWLLESDWNGALGSWLLLMFMWVLLAIPLAAYIAPGFRVHGVAANVVTAVLVLAANALVWRASPWRTHWQR
jgi:hypothetical protein